VLPIIETAHLGLIDYREAWALQEQLLASLVDAKSKPSPSRKLPAGYLLFCSHPPVFTLGKSGKLENVLATEEELNQKGAKFVKTNRGGDITFHGPGQLVCYPVLDLDFFFTDLHRYMRCLEQAVIDCLKQFGIQAGRYPGYTGVWLEPENDDHARKICAMGVRTSRWVTMHGLALNVTTDLQWFNLIVPCGIEDKAVASMHLELGNDVEISDVESVLKTTLASQFGFDTKPANSQILQHNLVPARQ